MQDRSPGTHLDPGAIEDAIRTARLARYMVGAGYDRETALRIYLWNCSLSQAFQFPLHMAEIVARNAIQKGLRVRFRNPWYEQPNFLRLLDARSHQHLMTVVRGEHAQHGVQTTDDHIVSSLHFGFWDHLTTKRFGRTLWLRGIRHSFPGAYTEGKVLQDINHLIQRVRQWRNRIAHYRAIFDREPARKHDKVLMLIRWANP